MSGVATPTPAAEPAFSVAIVELSTIVTANTKLHHSIRHFRACKTTARAHCRPLLLHPQLLRDESLYDRRMTTRAQIRPRASHGRTQQKFNLLGVVCGHCGACDFLIFNYRNQFTFWCLRIVLLLLLKLLFFLAHTLWLVMMT